MGSGSTVIVIVAVAGSTDAVASRTPATACAAPKARTWAATASCSDAPPTTRTRTL